MKKILIQIVLLFFPIVINCQDFTIYQSEVLDAINELRTGNNLPPVNKEEKLSKILEEIIVPLKPPIEDLSESTLKIDSTQLYHLFNENGIHDYNFTISECVLETVDKQEIKKYFQTHFSDFIRNSNIEKVGIKILKARNNYNISILSIETYIVFNELIRDELWIDLFNNSITYDKMIITGNSKINNIKYIPLTSKEFKNSNAHLIHTFNSQQLKLKDDYSFDLEIELLPNGENIIQSFFITDSLYNILSFYIIR